MNKPNNKHTFGYRGIVTTELYHGKQLINTHQYHNDGLPQFFRGLCLAITGNANVIDIVPRYIVLFTMLNGTDVNSSADWSEFCSAFSDTTSQAISMATRCLPVDALITKNTELIQSELPVAQIQVRIPYSLISSETVYAMALFSAQGAAACGLLGSTNSNSLNYTSMQSQALAFYKLLTVDGASWDPIRLNRTVYDGSLAINWQMDFNNLSN